jgi:hypothetical protein
MKGVETFIRLITDSVFLFFGDDDKLVPQAQSQV